MISSEQLQKIRTEARPLIEQQMDIALQLAAMRDVVATAGGDWSALKAVIKAEIQDKVAKVRDKAESTLAYADMLGLGNLNEKNSFAFSLARTIDHDPETGEITEPADPASAGAAADVRGGKNAPVSHVDTNSTENVGASAGRLHSDDCEVPTGSPAGVSVDTNQPETANSTQPQGYGGTDDETTVEASASVESGSRGGENVADHDFENSDTAMEVAPRGNRQADAVALGRDVESVPPTNVSNYRPVIAADKHIAHQGVVRA